MRSARLAATLLLSLILAPLPLTLLAQEVGGPELMLTVLFDNLTEEEGLQTGWGFAALLETPGHTVLFDTGADGEALLHNMDAMGVNPSRIEAIVISHAHGDHTNGMSALLELGIRPKLYVLAAFPGEAVNAFAGPLEPILTEPGQEIVPGVRTTGRIGESIPEQGLILETRDGPVVLTGCAHPGPTAMVARAEELSGQRVFGLLGGLHLYQTPAEEVASIISTLKEQGVEMAGATHCTGPEAMAAFQEAFGEGYVPMGVGRVIRLPLS
jgi:7,8-dihydropterin-6-yl-methyl-4-(beta-D-ribofuranosyl)aminobenzene 5'-phosphate synthase